ncbi:hypothetical protein MTO96_044338, partial [Rhipicephalus appendiculatus]
EIMCALESRAWDKDALEFVRQQKKRKSWSGAQRRHTLGAPSRQTSSPRRRRTKCHHLLSCLAPPPFTVSARDSSGCVPFMRLG